MAKTKRKPLNINDTVPYSDEHQKIRLSFFFYTNQDQNFHPKKITKSGYTEKFADKFKHLCSLTKDRLPSETDEHTHPIKWETVKSKPRNYEDVVNPQLEGYDWWQISITQGAKQTGHGRLIGFFVGNTFFLVWFDPAHMLYPRK